MRRMVLEDDGIYDARFQAQLEQLRSNPESAMEALAIQSDIGEWAQAASQC